MKDERTVAATLRLIQANGPRIIGSDSGHCVQIVIRTLIDRTGHDLPLCAIPMLDEWQPIIEYIVANTPEFNGSWHRRRCSENRAAVGVRAKNKVPTTARGRMGFRLPLRWCGRCEQEPKQGKQ